MTDLGFKNISISEIQRVIRDYHKPLYDYEMDNVEELDKFLERHSCQRLNQEEIENMNRPIKGTETVIKSLPINEVQKQMASHGEAHQTFREESKPIFLKSPKNCIGRNRNVIRFNEQIIVKCSLNINCCAIPKLLIL